MSQRNRSIRGSTRNTTASHGEEISLWESSRDKITEVLTLLSTDNVTLASILSLDAVAAEEARKDANFLPTYKTLMKMEELCRAGVRQEDNMASLLRNLIEQLTILKGVQSAKEAGMGEVIEKAGRGANARTREARERERDLRDRKEKDDKDSKKEDKDVGALYDFDGPADSPAPSVASRRHERSERASRGADRDSAPPVDDGTPAPDAKSARTKPHIFAKGDAVAFKPKLSPPDGPADWILGEVKAVLGEGKSRRYKVLDADPEDPASPKEYRSSASSMIPISEPGARLAEWEAGKKVLAMYPQTTTFYPAEVAGCEGGKVMLRFEGENDSTTMQAVERRFVVEFRA